MRQKKIKQLEDTVKQMMKQTREDEQGKKSLKAELAKANNLVAKISNEQEATQKESTNKTQAEKEEYPTDSEEERVLRNKHRGRGFLKAKRSKEKPKSQEYKCAECDEQFKTETELESHKKSHKSDEEILVQSKNNGFRRTDPMISPTAMQAKHDNIEINTLCHICSLRCQNGEKLMTHMKNHTEQSNIYNMSSMQKAIKEFDLTGATAKITPKVTEEKTNKKPVFQRILNVGNVTNILKILRKSRNT